MQRLFSALCDPAFALGLSALGELESLYGIEARSAVPLCASLQTRQGHSRGVAFIDATLLAVCHPKRARRPKVFAGLAR